MVEWLDGGRSGVNSRHLKDWDDEEKDSLVWCDNILFFFTLWADLQELHLWKPVTAH